MIALPRRETLRHLSHEMSLDPAGPGFLVTSKFGREERAAAELQRAVHAVVASQQQGFVGAAARSKSGRSGGGGGDGGGGGGCGGGGGSRALHSFPFQLSCQPSRPASLNPLAVNPPHTSKCYDA